MVLSSLEPLVGIPGWNVETALFRDKKGEIPEVILCLARKEARYRCQCGREFTGYYDKIVGCGVKGPNCSSCIKPG